MIDTALCNGIAVKTSITWAVKLSWHENAYSRPVSSAAILTVK